MASFDRLLNLPSLLAKRSHFLFGPRATGKSFLIREQLGDKAIVINLLRSEYYLRLSAEPYLLEKLLLTQVGDNQNPLIVIDEVQKVPLLLDEVHRLIEEQHWTFLLTGSSARKLKHGHANLLAGRARTAELFPLAWPEMPKFNLEHYLQYGGLPLVVTSDEPWEDLESYVNTYLYEEIQAESVVRQLRNFSNFLRLAALTNGQILNYSKIANDVGVSLPTIREYYQILEDTLLGFIVPAWIKSQKRKAASSGKFYLFDLGVSHMLSDVRQLNRHSDLYGRAFEHWIALELRSFLSYRRKHTKLSFWRSQSHLEVDFLVDETHAFEVKATNKITNDDLKGLRALAEEQVFQHYYLISNDVIPQVKEGIICLPWQDFIEKLWADKII